MNKKRRFRTRDADEMFSLMNHELVNIRERATRNTNVTEEKQ